MVSLVVLQPMKDSSASKLGHLSKKPNLQGRHYGIPNSLQKFEKSILKYTQSKGNAHTHVLRRRGPALVSCQARAMSTRSEAEWRPPLKLKKAFPFLSTTRPAEAIIASYSSQWLPGGCVISPIPISQNMAK